MPKNNRVTELSVELLVQYISVIIFILSICYIVIVTNPPSELLEYNENLRGMVTRQLSGEEISRYGVSLFPFIALFALIMFFNGYLTGLIFVKEIRSERVLITLIPFIFTLSSIMILGYMLWPYYGLPLALLTLFIGISAYYSGMLSEKSEKFRLTSLIMWLIAALAGAILADKDIVLAIATAGMFIYLIIEIVHSLSKKTAQRIARLLNNKRPKVPQESSIIFEIEAQCQGL